VNRGRHTLTAAASALALVGTASLGSQPVARGGAVPQWELLASPAAVGSMAPQITAEGGRAILSWIEGAGSAMALKFAERSATGWSPVRVVASGDQLMANSADVPSVIVLGPTSLVAAWLEQHGEDPEAYDIRLSWSIDTGRTWSKPVSPHHDGTQTQHGFVSLFKVAGGGVGLVWLDGRAFQATPSNASMSLRATTYSPEPNPVQKAETLVDARVCDCCPLSTAVTADGVIVAYRDRSPDDVRDIAVSRLSNGRWTAPVRVHEDGWKIAACPVNGPAVSARGRDVAVAWSTVVQGRGRALVAFSKDSGRTFGEAFRVDDEQSMGRPQIAWLDDGAVAVSWVEFSDGRSQFRLRRIDSSGIRSPAATIADGMGAQHPRLARRQDELLLAWVENTRGTTRVRTAHAPANFEPGRKN
jgi:hypothetical protein